MNRPILVCAMYVAAAAALAAQTQQSNPYEGTSNPPPDTTILDSTPPVPVPPKPKPSPAQYAPQTAPAQTAPAQPGTATQPAAPMTPAQGQAYAPANNEVDGTDDGIVQVAPDEGAQPALNERSAAYDPDGDIVHPEPLPPGTLGYGVTIRARLLERLSSAYNRDGDRFRTRVLSDVYQGDQVLIPAGSEIDGFITHISMGHAGGHGSMILRPETVILPGGQQFRMYAQLASTPDSNTRVGNEGTITPGSRLKKDGIEYGAAAGAGAITGAVVAGPAGALAGTLIGAGAITVHLLVSHPQVTLEDGTTLQFMLTEPLNLVAAAQPQPQMQMQPQPQMQEQPQTEQQPQDQTTDQPAQAPYPQSPQNQ